MPASETVIPVKIALVIDDTLDSTDGVQQVILEVGRWLTAQGHEVHYLTSSTIRTDIPNIHSLARNLRFKFNGNRVGIPLPASRSALKDLLDREKFDLVHVAIPYSPLLAGQIVSLLPVSTTLVSTFMILPLGFVSKWGGKLLGLWQRPQVKRFDRFMSLSAPASDFSRFMYGRPSIPTGSPVDIAAFARARTAALATPRDPGAPVKVLFLGRLVERKGAGALLQALARVASLTDTPFEAEIAGRGPLLAEYEAFVAANGLTDRVRFSGFIEEEDKADLLAGADIIALPALGGESFGISVVEALAAGTGAVLAGDNLGYSSTIGPLTECLINPRDIDIFAHRLTELIDSAELRTELSKRQAARAADFAPEVVGAKIERVYAEAVASRRAVLAEMMSS